MVDFDSVVDSVAVVISFLEFVMSVVLDQVVGSEKAADFSILIHQIDRFYDLPSKHN